MTVQDLIDTLSEMNPEAKVRLAMQPSWAMEYTIGRIVEVVDDPESPNSDCTVYLSEGNQEGYLPGVAQEELGWN